MLKSRTEDGVRRVFDLSKHKYSHIYSGKGEDRCQGSSTLVSLRGQSGEAKKADSCIKENRKLILCGGLKATRAVDSLQVRRISCSKSEQSLQGHEFRGLPAGKSTAMVFFTVWIDSIVCGAKGDAEAPQQVAKC